ncbi:MAG: hypothetical protein NZO16_00575 [Deltaproteobacteria bacterium]|nr:hypothetical protein [Deltaproteobacteria bacterium]
MSPKIDQLISTLNSTNQGVSKKRSEAQQTKDQFLNMLIAQLKNQDPLNPVSNDRFAVDLATFSQLEQLISINEKLSSGDNSFISSAHLLGKTVVLKDPLFYVVDGKLQESIFVNVDGDYDSLRAVVYDSNGNQLYQTSIDEFRKGKNLISIEALNIPDGSYSIKVFGVKNNSSTELQARPAVTLHGFIPGETPVFISGVREISLADVAEIWQI